MTVAFDTAIESVRTTTTDPWTWDHVPSGTPKAIVVSAVQAASATDFISSVTYGGVTMTRVQTNTDTANEVARSYLYFLGENIPTGTQTVNVDLTSATGADIQFVSMSFTAGGDTEIIDNDGLDNNQADPRVTLTVSGKPALAVCCIFSGHPDVADLSLLSGMSAVADHDFGVQVARVDRQTSSSTSDFTIGYTATTDDVAFSALSIVEKNLLTTPDLITNLGVVYEPTVKVNQAIDTALIENLGSTFQPSVAQAVAVSLIDNPGETYQPSTLLSVSAALIEQLGTPFDASIVQVIDIGLITQLGVVYDIAADVAIMVDLVTQTGTTYEPTVVQSVSPGLIDQTGVLYAFDIAGSASSVEVALIEQLGVTYDPSPVLSVATSLIEQLGVTYIPFIELPIPLIENLGITYSPTTAQSLEIGLIELTPEIYAPELRFFVSSDLIINWVLIESPGKVLVLDWGITSAIGQQVTIDWAGTQAVGSSLTLDWNKDNPSPYAALTLDWSLLSVIPVNIFYDGTDITYKVRAQGCTFTTRAGGYPGTANVVISAPSNEAPGYITGKTLELQINDEWVWRGFVTKISHEYPFEYDATDGVTPKTRWIRLEGVDLNILFDSRVVFRKSDPMSPGPEYPADNTPDVVAIEDLVTDYLDLSTDGLDVSSMVENVGTINEDQTAYPIKPSEKWGSAMRQIAALPGAIFYIDPDKRLVYTDVDTPNATYGLSDTPAADSAGPGLDYVGYREMTFTNDATVMCNDYRLYGLTGAGNVFEHRTDAGSITDHGLWQDASVRSDVYKEATAERIAYVNVIGSPQNKRGRRYDQPKVTVTTLTHGFRVAQKVNFKSHAHGLEDVYPIRALTVNFPDGFITPIYTLFLNHDVDSLSFTDLIPLPRINVIPPEGPEIPSYLYPGIIIDSFSRLLIQGWDEYGPLNNAWTDGWGSGEQTSLWNLSGNPHWAVGSGKGAMWNNLSFDPRVHEGFPGAEGWGKTASTTVNSVAVGGKYDGHQIKLKNLLITFRIGRTFRPYHSTSILTIESNCTLPPGIGWDNPLGASDWKDWPFEPASLEGQTTAPAFIMAPGCAVMCKAEVLVQVPAGGHVLNIVRVGNMFGGQTSNTTGGGLINLRYANGAGTTGMDMINYWGGQAHERTFLFMDTYVNNAALGFTYIPGGGIAELLVVGVDADAFTFNQQTKFSFSGGGSTVTFDRSSGEFEGVEAVPGTVPHIPYITTNAAAGAPAVPPPGYVGSSWAGVKTIIPNQWYTMRWYRPNDNGSFVKVWYAGPPGPDGGNYHSVIDYNEIGPTTPDGTIRPGDLIEPEPTGPASWLAGDFRQGWDVNQNGPSSMALAISGWAWEMQAYNLEIDHIETMPGDYGLDDALPTIGGPGPGPGAWQIEVFYPEPGRTTYTLKHPYVAGSLTIHLNGLIQRKGLDYEETSPSSGTFTLLFTPANGDILVVEYVIA